MAVGTTDGEGLRGTVSTDPPSVDLRLVPENLVLDLFQEDEATANSLWHVVPKPTGVQLSIKSNSETPQRWLLFVDSDAPGFSSGWARLNYPARRASELQGGDSVDAQDIRVLPGAVILYLLPGETRHVTLQFEARLSKEVRPGNYRYRMTAKLVTNFEIAPSLRSASNPERHLRDLVRLLPTSASPGVLSLRHPSSKLVDMLPSIYREGLLALVEDGPGYQEPPFFERYLVGFEDCINPLRQTVATLDRLFGPYSAPPDFLVWLAAWVCLPVDENWSEMKTRQLIGEAVELFRWRGTIKGLKRFLEIYLGSEPEIDDQPIEGMRLGPHAKLGTDQTVLGDVNPHTFVVTVTVGDKDSISEETIKDIIRSYKPAHTAFTLRLVTSA